MVSTGCSGASREIEIPVSNSEFLKSYTSHIQHNVQKIKELALPVKTAMDEVDKKPGMMLVTPGDVPFLSEGEHEVLTGSFGKTVGHAVIILDNRYIIEAVGNGIGETNKVIKSDLDDFLKNKEFYVIWAKLSDAIAPDYKGLEAACYAEKQLGKPYNWNFFNRNSTEEFYCSQLCWRAWLEQGYKIDYDEFGANILPFPKTWVSPNDLIAGNWSSYPKYFVCK